MHEPGDVALLRELAEEMAEEARIERLVWVVDNLYEHRGVRYHEASLYFLVSLPDDSPAYQAQEPWTGTEVDGTVLLFRWFRLDELELVNLLPSFLRTALAALPAGIEYVVHRDGE
jgi:ADP-ribose pyrophosphatase YjhB (NUDIX family)